MYRVQLDRFEGPLDLLLFFVRRDELDIRDIPIARITDEFLGYVRVLETIDLDAAADFIFVAAELIGIKAKMLLPRPPGVDGEDPEDPRRPLVERLLEYVRYKEAAGALEARADDRAQHFGRGAGSSVAPNEPEGQEDAPLRVSIFDLVSVLQRVLARAPASEPAAHGLRREEWSVEGQREWVMAHAARRTSFVGLVGGRPRGFVIATFLAVLELVRAGALRLVGGVSPDDFAVEASGTVGPAALPGGGGDGIPAGTAPPAS